MIINQIRIILPWPDRALFPNAKGGHHWATYQAAKTRARSDGYAAARHALGRDEFRAPGHIRASWVFAMPDLRRRDLDGIYGACKHFQDGIAAALKIDDSLFRPVLLDDRLDKDRRGYVEVTIG